LTQKQTFLKLGIYGESLLESGLLRQTANIHPIEGNGIGVA